MSEKDPDTSNMDLLVTIFGSLALALGLLFFLVQEEDTSPVNVAWLIPVFSIVSFVLILLLGSYDPRRGGSIAVIGVGFSSVFSFGVAYDVLINDVTHGGYIEATRIWFGGQTFAFEFGTYIDGLAGLLLLVVGFVSYLVVVFSLGYMVKEGDRQVRYFAEIALFVGVMLGLVVANSFLLMFIFWELVGVCSYLLIGFWYEKPSSASAAKKAFIVTRVGGLTEIVDEGQSGFTIEPNNPTELANVLETHLKNDTFLRMEDYIKTFKQKFSWEYFVDGIESLYSKI